MSRARKLPEPQDSGWLDEVDNVTALFDIALSIQEPIELSYWDILYVD